MTRLPLAVAALAALLVGCAAAPMERPDEPLITAPPEARPPALALPPPVAAAPAEAPVPAASGTLWRADVRRVLAGSPGAFLGHVEAVPAFASKRFRGWRIVSFFPGDPRLGGVLRPGDIVVKVNEQAIERPEQFGDVWQAAGSRADLSVDLIRDGNPARLSWRVVDGK